MSDELPEGWTKSRLGAVAESISYGYTARATITAKGPRYLRITDIQNNSVDWASVPSCIIAAKRIPAYRLRSGDLVFARTGATTGKSFLISSCPEAVFASYLIRVRPATSLVPEFIARFFHSASYWSQISENISGSAQPNCNATKLSSLVVPIPPLAEQRRIVAKLEKLLSHADSCHQRLVKVPALLKRFRQSVLGAACSGRLTADWRDTHKKVRSAQDLVQSLKTPDPESYLDIFERTSGGEIPEMWSWVSLGKLGPLTGGGTPSKSNPRFWGGNIPWVSPKDMKRNRIDDSEDHITDLALQNSSVSTINAGAILFVVRGMILIHTLPTAITDTAVTLNQDMKALVPEIKEMSEYLALAARHIAPSILFEVKEATHGTRRIESSILKNWAVPVPPLEEQQEIVRRVEKLLALADRLELRLAEVRRRVDSLTQAVLSKAFRGELVPTEFELAKAEGRSFESATELLHRIGRNGKN